MEAHVVDDGEVAFALLHQKFDTAFRKQRSRKTRVRATATRSKVEVLGLAVFRSPEEIAGAAGDVQRRRAVLVQHRRVGAALLHEVLDNLQKQHFSDQSLNIGKRTIGTTTHHSTRARANRLLTS